MPAFPWLACATHQVVSPTHSLYLLRRNSSTAQPTIRTFPYSLVARLFSRGILAEQGHFPVWLDRKQLQSNNLQVRFES